MMKKLLLGGAIGLGVSAGAAVAPYGLWTKVSVYMEKSETYQYGHEQGAWDAFSSLDAARNKEAWDWDCFRKHMLLGMAKQARQGEPDA